MRRRADLPMASAAGVRQEWDRLRDMCQSRPSSPFQNTLTVSAPDTAGDGCEPSPLASSVGPCQPLAGA